MEVTITVDARQVRALLDQTPSRIDRALRAGATEATIHLLKQMKVYPPQRAGSKYVRTHNLFKSWSRRIEGSGIEIVGYVTSNGNMTETKRGDTYNRLVQDRTRQARVHRGTWTNTVQEVAERSERAINDMFQERIRAAVG